MSGRNAPSRWARSISTRTFSTTSVTRCSISELAGKAVVSSARRPGSDACNAQRRMTNSRNPSAADGLASAASTASEYATMLRSKTSMARSVRVGNRR